jgi:peptide/nickel transport system substrate-binding protein
LKKQIIILVSLMVCIFLLFGCKPATTTTTAVKPPPTAVTSATVAPPATTTPAVPRSVLQSPQGTPTSGPVPQYGGTVKMIWGMACNNLGAPWKSMTGFERSFSRFAIENLVGLDTKGNPVPQLATGWQTDPTAKTITFTLRQGVNFQDGTPFNASAVKWCMDTYRTGTLQDLKLVSAVDVIDDNHVKLTLSVWDPVFISNLSSSGGGKISSPTAAQKMGDDILRNPVGTGPFKIAGYVPNVSFKFVRFDGYWQKGLPYLDAIEVNIVADSVVALASFMKGEANWCSTQFTPQDIKNLKAKGFIDQNNYANIWGLAPDSKNPTSPLADIRVRQAIAYAIDKDTDVNAIFGGLKPPANQLAATGFPAYDATIKGYPYNPVKAKELLGLAGYNDAHPLTVTMSYTSTAQATDFYTAVQNDLKKVGINFVLAPLDNATTTKMIASGWTNGFVDFRLSYNVEKTYSSSLQENLSTNPSRYPSIAIPDAYNTLFNTMIPENDLAKRITLYQQLNKMAVDEYCMVIPLYVNVGDNMLTPNTKDFNFWNITTFEFLPEIAWISK